jgi:hypothetical protein
MSFFRELHDDLAKAGTIRFRLFQDGREFKAGELKWNPKTRQYQIKGTRNHIRKTTIEAASDRVAEATWSYLKHVANQLQRHEINVPEWRKKTEMALARNTFANLAMWNGAGDVDCRWLANPHVFTYAWAYNLANKRLLAELTETVMRGDYDTFHANGWNVFRDRIKQFIEPGLEAFSPHHAVVERDTQRLLDAYWEALQEADPQDSPGVMETIDAIGKKIID